MSQQYATIVSANESPLPVFTAPQCAVLQDFLLSNIPLAATMQLQVGLAAVAGQSMAAAGICITAPLAPNINDKGSAFGGAGASLMTLAGWGWLWLANRQMGLRRDIVIASSQIQYHLPVYESLHIICSGPTEESWMKYLQSLRKRDRARLELRCELRLADAGLAASMQGHYATLKECSEHA